MNSDMVYAHKHDYPVRSILTGFDDDQYPRVTTVSQAATQALIDFSYHTLTH